MESSLLFPESRVPEGTTLSRVILGPDARIEEGETLRDCLVVGSERSAIKS